MRTTVPKERGQVGIDEIQIAPDGKTAGWFVLFEVDGVSYPVPATLIVWRANHAPRRFSAEQSFYSWAFYSQGKQVAFHVGPLHGERQSHCELHDVDTGRLVAVWEGDLVSPASHRPPWTGRLNH